MLLKIKNRIFNTAHIVDAQFTDASSKSVLVLHTVDTGDRNLSAASAIIFHGQEACVVWQALSKEAQEIT